MENQNRITRVETFGDVRRLLIENIMAIRDGNIDVNRGMAIAANVKVLNDNIQAEINAAKMSIATEKTAYKFGNIVHMGKRLIAESGTAESARDACDSPLIAHQQVA